MAAAPPDLALAGARAMEATPGIAELGLGGSERGGGGQEPVDPSDVLYVRGAAADLKLVLLDGAPVYAPFPLGGVIPSLEPGVLHSARLYLGGAPARYDGGLAYIMELKTRGGRGDAFRTSGAVDALSARLRAEGPLGGRVSYLAAGRGIHGLGMGGVGEDGFPYGYAEGLLRLDAEVGAEGALSVTGFANRETVRLDSLGARHATPGWENRAVSLRYRGALGGVDAEVTAAVGQFGAELPVGGPRAFSVRGTTRRTRLAADLAQSLGSVRLTYGAGYERQHLGHTAWSLAGAADSLLLEREAVGESAGAYLDAGWQVAPRLRVRGGLRADLFSVGETARVAPRAALTWLLSERAALTLAGGRYHQYVRVQDVVLAPSGGAATDTVPIPSRLSVARASHVSLLLDQEFAEGLRLGLEGFFKTFEGAPVGAGAHASGMDVWVRRSAGRATGWVGYSLAWIWADPGASPGTELFAGRHALNGGVAGPLGSRGSVELRVAYGAGLPFTAVSIPTSEYRSPSLQTGGSSFSGTGDTPPIPTPPASPYLRVDLDVSRTWTPRWRGTQLELTPYLRVLNALDRRDTLFYWYDPRAEDGARPLAALPVVPVLGVEWRF